MDTDSAKEDLSFRIETALTGDKVPVVNEVHLHSIYDPVQEAIALAEKYLPALQKSQNILILGLGFGYHVREIMERMRALYQDDFHLVVVEPFKKLIDECRINVTLAEGPQLTILQEDDVERLYSKSLYTDFLLNRPGIVYHQASFSVHTKFFKDLITFRSSQELREIARFVDDGSLKNYLLQGPCERYDDAIQYLKREKKRLDDPFDFFLLALDAL